MLKRKPPEQFLFSGINLLQSMTFKAHNVKSAHMPDSGTQFRIYSKSDNRRNKTASISAHFVHDYPDVDFVIE